MNTDELLKMRSVTMLPRTEENLALVWHTWAWTLYSYAVKGLVGPWWVIDNMLRYNPSREVENYNSDVLSGTLLFELAVRWGFIPKGCDEIPLRKLSEFDTACHEASYAQRVAAAAEIDEAVMAATEARRRRRGVTIHAKKL